MPKTKLYRPRIEIYKDKRGELRWRLTFRNKTLADSGEGYKRRASLDKALERVFRTGYAAVYEIVEVAR